LLGLSNRVLPIDSVFYDIEYTLERDAYGNYNDFVVRKVDSITLSPNYKELDTPDNAKFAGKDISIYGLFYKDNLSKYYSELYYRNIAKNSHSDYDTNKTSYLELGLENITKYPIFKDITGKRINLPRKE
jgi:hypothetical protein